MGRLAYDKLIRDRIPEIIEGTGRTCGVEVMDEDTFVQYLERKLLEEAREIALATAEERVGEVADLLEVIDALIQVSGMTWDDVKAMQLDKRHKRGGFERRLRLLWTE